jgi:hypothetical protein
MTVHVTTEEYVIKWPDTVAAIGGLWASAALALAFLFRDVEVIPSGTGGASKRRLVKFRFRSIFSRIWCWRQKSKVGPQRNIS